MIEAVVSAVITATPPGALAALAWINSRRTRAEVGQTNGNGTVAQMLTTLIERQTTIGEKLEKHMADDATSIEELKAAIERRN